MNIFLQGYQDGWGWEEKKFIDLMRERKEILIDLVQNPHENSILAKELSVYPWDCDETLYIITSEDIRSVLDQFALNIIDEKVLEDWANAVECREDLGYENDELDEIIFELANPDISGDSLSAIAGDCQARLPAVAVGSLNSETETLN
jgi:hypothetical protein